jgi:hypothetical protein
MAEEWRIQRDRKSCERPGCPLPTSRSWFAVLEWPACVRHDLCDACFQDHERRCTDGPPIFWRALRKASGTFLTRWEPRVKPGPGEPTEAFDRFLKDANTPEGIKAALIPDDIKAKFA